MSIESLNAAARKNALELANKFPELTPDQARFWARFTAAAPAVLAACEARLNEDGKTLSEAGVEFCLRQAAALAK